MKKFILTCAVVMALIGGGAIAQETSKAKKPSEKMTKEVTPELRKNMAAMHEKMARCLRSDKPMSECRNEMHAHCMEMMGKDGCPMMGEMGGMMGGGKMYHGGMMDGQDESK